MTGTYIGRGILNTRQLRDWAALQGLPALDVNLHVTLLYSPVEVPLTPETETVEAHPAEAGKLGPDGAVVVFLDAPELEARHWYFREELGAESTYDSFRPHVTLFYDVDWGDRVVPLPDFPILLGPEQVASLGEEVLFPDRRATDGLAKATKGNPYHDKEDGRFTSKSGVGTGYRYRKGTQSWHNAGGVRASVSISNRMKELAIPPGWKDVRLNPDPHGALQAVGVDSKGRTQPRYSKAHQAKQSAAKFARLKEFMQVLPRLRAAINNDLKDPSSPHHDTAAALRLIDRTGFRVGSDKETGAEKQAYGATTLLARHLTLKGDHMRFQFVGKKGVTIQHQLSDPALASFLGPRKGKGGRLFHTDDDALRSYVKEHTGGDHFKVKDFRTFNATHLALKIVGRMRETSTEKEFLRAQKAVATQVAQHLGNTAAVVIKSYIDPVVWTRLRRKHG